MQWRHQEKLKAFVVNGWVFVGHLEHLSYEALYFCLVITKQGGTGLQNEEGSGLSSG